MRKSIDPLRALSCAPGPGWQQQDELTPGKADADPEPVHLDHELVRGASRSDTSWTRILYQDLFSAVAAHDGLAKP